MAKHSDVRKAGRSEVCPYIPGEDSGHRHDRRKKTAEENIERLQRYCEKKKLSLEIKNGGHHWIIKSKRIGIRAEWFPSTAKLVINQKWERGVHVHDVYQIMDEIDNWLYSRRPKKEKARRKKNRSNPGRESRFSKKNMKEKQLRDKHELESKLRKLKENDSGK